MVDPRSPIRSNRDHAERHVRAAAHVKSPKCDRPTIRSSLPEDRRNAHSSRPLSIMHVNDRNAPRLSKRMIKSLTAVSDVSPPGTIWEHFLT